MNFKDFENYQPETLKLTLDLLKLIPPPRTSPIHNLEKCVEKAYKLKTDPGYVSDLKEKRRARWADAPEFIKATYLAKRKRAARKKAATR